MIVGPAIDVVGSGSIVCEWEVGVKCVVVWKEEKVQVGLNTASRTPTHHVNVITVSPW